MTGTIESVHQFDAMASPVTVRLRHEADPAPLTRAAEQIFAEIERTCTRFDPASALMQANIAGRAWAAVPASCLEALREAYDAHRRTGGLFDPRVLTPLEQLGYDTTFATVSDSSAPVAPAPVPGRWHPEFRSDPPAVRIGPHPVDLGGIGKGLAVRKAAQLLRSRATDFLIEAGGDCYLAGRAPDGTAWSVGVEDPFGGETPRAVLALSDVGCATSSTRLRTWRRGGRQVHHLIDPRTGAPADDGIVAVTVVDPDPVRAEVFSKVLFLAGRTGIERRAGELGLPALWIDQDGRLTSSPDMTPLISWRV